ncbi:Glutathione peroxidase, partial [Operophtera brumata]
FSTWTNPDFKKAYDGNLLNKFSLTHLLDNVMIYWATNTITTSFRHELVHHSDSMLRLKYTRYVQSTIVHDGGHFAALENPDLLAHDVFEAVRAFRQLHGASQQHTRRAGLTPINVASQCGLTDTNYRELNELHKKYYDRGLRILAFPCNQFNSQEPGTAADIIKFTNDINIKFDLFEKVDVNGAAAAPLWQFLKQLQGGTLGDFIKWNFSKFIIDRNGMPVKRFGSNVNPKDMESDLVTYL